MSKRKAKRPPRTGPDRVTPPVLPYTCPKCGTVCTPCISTPAGRYQARCASCGAKGPRSESIAKALNPFVPTPKGTES